MTFLFLKNMCKACIVCKQFLYMYQTKLCKLVLVDATKRNVGQIKLISYIVSTDVFFHQQWSEKIVYFEHSLGSNLSSGTLQFTLLVKWHCEIWLKWMTTILIFPCDIYFPKVWAVGIGKAEGLQPHQHFRITVVKSGCSPTNIWGLL